MMAQPPDANLMRLYCDGELSPEQAAEFEQSLLAATEQHLAIKQQIEIERKFRSCVGSAMKGGCPCAPRELDDRIRLLFSRASETSAESADVVGRIVPADDAIPASSGRQQASRAVFFQGANIFAIAATLALIAGAILFGIFGRQIDDVTPLSGADLAAVAAISASERHDSVAASRQQLAKQRATDASAQLTQWLGVPVHVFDLSDLGYEFVGAERCEIKLPDRTAQLVYQAIGDSTRKPMVSVFIAPYSVRCGGICENMEIAKWACAGKDKCRHNVLYSTDRRLVYFLVCCKEDDLAKLTARISQIQAIQGR